jgi:hypothetical protein
MRGMKLPRFSLRMLLVAMAPLCVSIAWAGWWVRYNHYWIRQRHAYLSPQTLVPTGLKAKAPWPLGWFGEPGVYEVMVRDSTVEHVQILFPEAGLLLRETQPNGDSFRIIAPKEMTEPNRICGQTN